MVKFALIGGRTNSNTNICLLEESLIKQSKKEKPNVLFCPYATKDYNITNNKFMELVKNLNINLYLMTDNDYLSFDTLLKNADILYISGGCVNDLVAIFNKYNYKDILLKYLNDDKIYAGISAGAMLYTKYSMGDRDVYIDKLHRYNFKMVNCLNILNISICPHYQDEDLICYNDEVKNLDYVAFGIENDTMLIIDNNEYYIIKEDKKRSVYYFSLDKKMISLHEGVKYEEASSFRS